MSNRSGRAVALVLTVALAASCSVKPTITSEPGPCAADTFEPNDSAATRASLGAIQDDDEPISGPNTTVVEQRIKRELTTHAAGDVDWFDVDVRDTGIGGNPGLSVIVSSGYEATAWWACTNGTTKSVVCGLGTAVTTDPELTGKGCLTTAGNNGVPPQLTMQIECDGTSTDNGTLSIRVRRLVPSSSCERYTLTVLAD